MSQISPAQVQEWFRQAIGNTRFDVPALDQCDLVARNLKAISARHQELDGTTSIPLGKAEKLARSLNEILPHLRSDAASWLEEDLDPYARNSIKLYLTKIDDLSAALSGLLNLRHLRPNGYSWHTTARFVWNHAASAWHRSGKRGPRSLNPDDPMCTFVTLALAGMGVLVSQEAVSSALRKRRGPGSKKKDKTHAS